MSPVWIGPVVYPTKMEEKRAAFQPYDTTRQADVVMSLDVAS